MSSVQLLQVLLQLQLYARRFCCYVPASSVLSVNCSVWLPGPPRVASLARMPNQAPALDAPAAAPAAAAPVNNTAAFSFAPVVGPPAATQPQLSQPAPAVASSGPPPSSSTPTGAAPFPGGASLQLNAPSTTAGLYMILQSLATVG